MLDENSFREEAPALLQRFMENVINNLPIDIGTYQYHDDAGSIVPLDVYNTDENLLLSLSDTGQYKLTLEYHDLDGERVNHFYELQPEDLKIIPEGLKSIMQEVQRTKEETVFKNGSVT